MTCFYLKRQFVLLCLALSFSCASRFANAVSITINVGDTAGEGFLDATLGASRLTAMNYAKTLWEAQLVGTIPIVVNAKFDPLGGTTVSATLGAASPVTFIDGHVGQPMANTWYCIAEANQHSNLDNNLASMEINATFNSDVDTTSVLLFSDFYYGVDANPPGSNIDFVSVALHELSHGLGFVHLINPANGQWASGTPDIFGRNLTHQGVGAFDSLTDGQRLTALTSGNVFWNGTAVNTAHGSAIEMFSPGSYQVGSSIAHWDTLNSPNLLMEPAYTGPHHDLDFTIQAMEDIDWTVTIARIGDWSLY